MGTYELCDGRRAGERAASDAKCCKDGERRAQSSGAPALQMKQFSPVGVDAESETRFLEAGSEEINVC